MINWLRWLNPKNIILLKRLVDAIEIVVRLIEQIWPGFNPGNPKTDEENK